MARFVSRDGRAQRRAEPVALDRRALAAPGRAAVTSRSSPLASGLVRLDPGRRDARVAQHPVGHRPVAGRGVVLDRQRRALVRQVVEPAVVHRLADLSLDEALPRRSGLPGAIRIALRRAHGAERSAAP